ncbi:MAG: hypothetical protein M3P01_10500 [Actinomycetota bacterium]|nr:hypothetical protein [Actinomycetota bacterium]
MVQPPDMAGVRDGAMRYIFHRVMRVASRLGWGLADQGISSLTNFALGIVVARSLSPREFGAFSIAFGVYTTGLGLTRALTSEPLMVRFSAVSRDDWRVGARAATGTAVLIGAAAGLACLVAGLALSAALASVLLALGVCMPGLLLQDTWRYAFFSGGRGPSAFFNDVVWAVGLSVFMALLFATGRTSVGWLVLAWGGSGSVAGLAGMLQAGLIPALDRTASWFREQRDLIPRFAGEFGVTTLAIQVSIFAIGAVAGLATVGAIRAGQLLLGPLNIIFLGVSLAALPEAVRLLQSSKERLRRACVVLSAGLAAAALGVGIVASILPRRMGTELLGQNWSLAKSVVVPLSIWMAAAGVILGAGIGLRAMAAARRSLRARLMVAPLAVTSAVVGAAVQGARGAAWGFAGAYAVGAFIWWWSFLRGLDEHDRGSAGPSEEVIEPDEFQVRDAGLGA